jgi:hypothetical protein
MRLCRRSSEAPPSFLLLGSDFKLLEQAVIEARQSENPTFYGSISLSGIFPQQKTARPRLVLSALCARTFQAIVQALLLRACSCQGRSFVPRVTAGISGTCPSWAQPPTPACLCVLRLCPYSVHAYVRRW